MQEQNRAILAAGGPQADLLMSRWATGGSLLALGSYLSAQGIITGGGLDKQRNAEQLGGEQAYSVKVGDKYYSFNRLDPLGMFLGLSADFQQIADTSTTPKQQARDGCGAVDQQEPRVEDVPLRHRRRHRHLLAEQPRQVATLRQPPSRYARSSTGLVNQVAKEVDPEVKEVWTMMDAIKARIPGMSKDVPASRQPLRRRRALRGRSRPRHRFAHRTDDGERRAWARRKSRGSTSTSSIRFADRRRRRRLPGVEL
jgi:hypothetical protein